MTSLVIYDSQFGNTQKVAGQIARGAGAVLMPLSEAGQTDWSSLSLLVVGSPTHGGRPSQLVQQLLNRIPQNALHGIRAAAFDTGMAAEGQKFFIRMIIGFFGYAAKRTAALLTVKGAAVIASETFFVRGKEGPLIEGEERRAYEWGQHLGKI
ncbi:MAG: flavodoxin domain-containing protein [Patescibacteria group bacterium]